MKRKTNLPSKLKKQRKFQKNKKKINFKPGLLLGFFMKKITL
jgi:hypothetical protein